MKNTIYKSMLYIFVVVVFASCTTTREITSTRELENFKETGDVTVVTKDSLKYVLKYYFLKDTVLVGKGTLQTKDSLKSFDGKINFKDIKYVECQKTDLLKTAIGVGSAAVITYIVFKYFGTDNGVNNTVVIKYPAGCK
ncbi:MAG TPA: hypothetical protein VIL99_10360 [Ignavibacteria bacterium]